MFRKIIILFFTLYHMNSFSQNFRYLALGDSYTIGEAVPPDENFPSQLIKGLKSEHLLQEKFKVVNPPEIIATTGWTTGELIEAIAEKKPQGTYELVTLLIGVNNQYRGIEKGYSDELYKKEFEQLLQQAVHFAGAKKKHTLVVSIPDWGVTPFAEGRDRQQIAKEIDHYNEMARKICAAAQVVFIDITPGSRQAAVNKDLVASDGLHPSARMYKMWVDQILPEAVKPLR